MTWAWEALRGTVSSLVAPAVLLAAALVVAVGGSGADALSTLSQLTKGPEVPPTPVEMVSREAPVSADVGHLDGRLVASASARSDQSSAAAAAAAGSRQSGGGGGGGSAPSATGSAGGAPTPSPASSPAPGPAGAPSGGSGPSQGSAPSASAPSAPPSSPSPSAPSPRPNPLGEVLDQTQQLTDQLLKPVKPVTDQLLGGLQR